MTTVALSASAVADAVEALVPGSAPVRVREELRRGRSHASWIVESSCGSLVAKVARSQRRTSTLRLDEQRRLRSLGAMLVVSQYVPGRDAQQAADDPYAQAPVGEGVLKFLVRVFPAELKVALA